MEQRIHARLGERRDIGLRSWGMAALLLAGACGGYGPDDGMEIGSSSQPLYMTGAAWPNGMVPVCWDSATALRSDFDVRSTQVRHLANSSWPVYAHLYFQGWGTCGSNLAGKLRLRLNDDTIGLTSAIGYGSAGRTIDLGVQRTDFGGSLVPHELGHALGFAHEMARPDFPDDSTGACQAANIPGGNTLGTAPDRASIMASTGYCQENAQLSASDQKGVRTAYGAPRCERRTESHADPNTGQTFSTVWYCNNSGPNTPLYSGASFGTVVGYMDSTRSWFTCYAHGAVHPGNNDIWYYTQGDRTAAGQSGRHAWGYMPAVDLGTDVDPFPNMPQCCGGHTCDDTQFCSANRCCPLDHCVAGCPC